MNIATLDSQHKYPRRQFVARGSRMNRCDRCLLAPRACICSFRVQVKATARFCLLTHREELYKPTNTGRLIDHAIAETEVLIWNRLEPCERLQALLNDPTLAPCIVFPPAPDYQHRMVEQPVAADDERTPLFIILDGTWRQARRMFRHGQYLARLPVISIHQPMKSRYHLRKKIEENQLCTAEVAIAMLNQIHDSQAAQALDAYFDVFNEHYRASRLSRPIDDDQPAKQVLRALQKQANAGT